MLLRLLLLLGVAWAVPRFVRAAADTAPAAPLRVALVSGAETYRSDEAFAGLATYLEREHGMRCELLRFDATGTSLEGVERLGDFDTVVFHVRRKTLRADQLAALRRFFASGKGFVALRSTSHGWENWKEFDREVLGLRYGGPGGANAGNAERVILHPHPIWAGAETLTTRKDVYRTSEPAGDLTVIAEADTKSGRVPIAWTRPHGDARLVYLAIFYELDQPPLRRAVANAIRWVTAPAPAR